MDEENEFHEQFDALFKTKKELNDFDFDSYDWGCLRYILELRIFLGRLRKCGIRSIGGFFGDVLIWLTAKEELRRYDGRDYTAASMITFFLFVKHWSFIAYDIVNIFKRSLTPKYRNAGIEVLRRDLFHKSAVLSFEGESVKLEFNRRYEMRYNEQLASMNEFIDQTRDMIDLL
ncbi:MAG: hypothetical protein U9N36_10395 [Euryarchaeota archaeon]|nr:hypothetical protein [Euryarchaeota archaeon]